MGGAIGGDYFTLLSDFDTRLSFAGMLENNRVGVSIQGAIGKTFRLEATSDFVRWMPLGTKTNTSGTVSFTDEAANNIQHRFYRAVSP